MKSLRRVTLLVLATLGIVFATLVSLKIPRFHHYLDGWCSELS